MIFPFKHRFLYEIFQLACHREVINQENLVHQLVKILFSWLIMHMFASKFIFLSRGPRVFFAGINSLFFGLHQGGAP